MNIQLQNFARETIKSRLMQLGKAQQILFKRMYANGNLNMEINDVVDKMPEEKLDWAMQQIERTLRKGLI
jgi:hypothetical protein